MDLGMDGEHTHLSTSATGGHLLETTETTTMRPTTCLQRGSMAATTGRVTLGQTLPDNAGPI